MAYTPEQIKKYHLTPEQQGTFTPRIGRIEQQIIDQFGGGKEPTLPRVSEGLFREQIMTEQAAEDMSGSVKDKRVIPATKLLSALINIH